MKYVRYQRENQIKYGLLEDSAIHELHGTPFETFKRSTVHLELSEVELLAPIVPSKAICVGLNYQDHAREMNIELPKIPALFFKPPTAIVGPQVAIVYPQLAKQVDYEAELAVVIKRRGRFISEHDADDYILGYCCANDVTARDLQLPGSQWALSKGFDTFLPLGPVISDEVDPTNVVVESYLNGERKQSSSTRNLIFSVHTLVSYISQVMTLLPGDIILTGTPGGIGPMQRGDTIEIAIEGIGTLTNVVL